MLRTSTHPGLGYAFERALRSGLASAAVLTSLFSVPASAMSPDDMIAHVNARICPSDLTAYKWLSSNDICNPQSSVTKACDANFNAPSRAWQQCYRDVSDCRDQVDQENKKISAYNSFVYECRRAFYSSPDRPWSTSNYQTDAPASLQVNIVTVITPPAPPPPDPQPQQSNPYDPDPMQWGSGGANHPVLPNPVGLPSPDPLLDPSNPDPGSDPQARKANPYDPDPMQWGAGAGGDPGYGGVSVGVETQGRSAPGLGGVAGRVKGLKLN